MQNIGRHISELLFEHDCVIVPSLGGFLASNENSRMMPNRMIYPPYRRLAFNVYLKQSDGLLANYLVEAEGISYTAAMTRLEEFTFECIQALEQGRKVSVEEVGTLYFDHEKNIQFEAYRNINHSKDSFGLEPVQIVPVYRDAQEEKKRPAIKTIRPSQPSTEKKSIIGRKGKRLIGIAVVIAGIGLFFANLYLITPKQFEETSMNPFDSEMSVSQTLPKEESPTDLVPANIDTQPIAENTEGNTSDIAENIPPSESETLIEKNEIVKPAETSPAAVTKPEVTKPTTVTTPQIKPTVVEPTYIPPAKVTGQKHYIVSGVFKIQDNAMSQVSKLQSLGFPNARITEANGMYYVSYSEFDNAGEALGLVDSLHKRQLEGWIWKH